jgi:hypothetical protein
MSGNAGRPTLYTEEVGKEICARLADGESLNSICKADHMPHESTVRSWALDPEHPISTNYVRARELGYMRMADEIVEISDDGTNDWMERNHGDDKESSWSVNGEHVSRSKLRVDTRKWLLSKALPKVFGDKITAEHTGPDGAPLPENNSSRDLARAILDILRESKVTDGQQE